MLLLAAIFETKIYICYALIEDCFVDNNSPIEHVIHLNQKYMLFFTISK